MEQKKYPIIKRCPMCNWRVCDKISENTTGIIQMKCPNCHKVIEVDLSFRKARLAKYRRARVTRK